MGQDLGEFDLEAYEKELYMSRKQDLQFKRTAGLVLAFVGALTVYLGLNISFEAHEKLGTLDQVRLK